MTDINLDALIPSLEAKAAHLNELSERTNQLLAAIEKRLLDLNIGLELWHSEAIAVSDPEGNLGPDKTSSQAAQVFGFARVDGKWCLAVKPVRFVDGYFQGDMNCPYRNQYTDGPPTPLLKASRLLRVAALRAMPQFLSELSEHVSETIRVIEGTAEKLDNIRRA